MISKTLVPIVLLICVAVLSTSVPFVRADQQTAGERKTESVEPADVIKRGNKIGDSPVVSLADIIKDPAQFENKKIILEGEVTAVCQKKGCWMEVVPTGSESGVRVTFKDYGFFVPKDAAGFKVRAEGKIQLTELNKEEVHHLEEDGGHVCKNADGTASEIGFVAYGVELYRVK